MMNPNLICEHCQHYIGAACPPRCARVYYPHITARTPACVDFVRVPDPWAWVPSEKKDLSIAG